MNIFLTEFTFCWKFPKDAAGGGSFKTIYLRWGSFAKHIQSCFLKISWQFHLMKIGCFIRKLKNSIIGFSIFVRQQEIFMSWRRTLLINQKTMNLIKNAVNKLKISSENGSISEALKTSILFFGWLRIRMTSIWRSCYFEALFSTFCRYRY